MANQIKVRIFISSQHYKNSSLSEIVLYLEDKDKYEHIHAHTLT